MIIYALKTLHAVIGEDFHYIVKWGKARYGIMCKCYHSIKREKNPYMHESLQR
jgi:hypothetical protein